MREFAPWERETIHWDWNEKLQFWICRENGETRTEQQMAKYRGTFDKVTEEK